MGDAMRIDGCDGTLGGNWALYEDGSDNVFKGDLFATSIELDQLLASFNSFDIEDLDASNLLGEASATATVSLTFDSEWEQHSTKTDIRGKGEIRNGTLQHYAPLQELSAFIDQGELDKIDFPYLASSFRVHGDTLLLPEMEVKNSAMNLWVNGWQNLESDDIRYSVRIGLKDLAMRGKNSNRDLGNWIGEAENENQPYVRLIVLWVEAVVVIVVGAPAERHLVCCCTSHDRQNSVPTCVTHPQLFSPQNKAYTFLVRRSHHLDK